MKNQFFLLTLLSVSFICGCSATFYDMGKQALDYKKYREAAEYFNKEISTSPYNNAAWRDLGVVNLKQEDYPQAEENLLKAFELKSNDGETVFYLGLLYENINDYDKAISYYKQYNSLGFFDDDIIQKIEGRIKLISRKKIEAEIKTILQNENLIENETLSENTLAVLYFQNIGDKSLDPLQKGLADMIITDLSQVRVLKIVERVKLQMLIDEMKLSSSSLFDQQNAPRFGKLLKAKNLLKGTYLNFDNENLRIDAALINVADGSFRYSKEVTGSLADYFKMQKSLVFNILDEIGVHPTNEEREAIQVIPTESYLAFLSYCRGLESEDQGRYADAIDQFRIAAEIDPSFKQAEIKQKEMQGISDGVDIEAIEKGIKTEDLTLGRLFESDLNLTEELYSGRDDRKPTMVKVIIQINK